MGKEAPGPQDNPVEMGGVAWGGRARWTQGPGRLSDQGKGLKLRLGLGCWKRGLSPEAGAQTSVSARRGHHG